MKNGVKHDSDPTPTPFSPLAMTQKMNLTPFLFFSPLAMTQKTNLTPFLFLTLFFFRK